MEDHLDPMQAGSFWGSRLAINLSTWKNLHADVYCRKKVKVQKGKKL